jgi:hypothetical protein
MPGPVAVWAAKKFLKSKTGQKMQAQVHGAVTGAVSDLADRARGHPALSGQQFPDSPPWSEPSDKFELGPTPRAGSSDEPPWSTPKQAEPPPPW